MKDRRRALRANQTGAERKVWALLRGRDLAGFKFRRQFSVGPYIVDFYCPQKHLCIEIDGGQHASSAEYDARRTAYLNDSGIRVVRFWNNQVLENLEGVYSEIVAALDA
jgi:very-short-patch-repair endonuclease